MRVHAIYQGKVSGHQKDAFQYRKRYEGACNKKEKLFWKDHAECFNTVNGMRVHAMPSQKSSLNSTFSFNTVNGMRVHAMQDNKCLTKRQEVSIP